VKLNDFVFADLDGGCNPKFNYSAEDFLVGRARGLKSPASVIERAEKCRQYDGDEDYLKRVNR